MGSGYMMMRYKEVVFWLGCKHPVAIASDHVRHGNGPEPVNPVLMKGDDAAFSDCMPLSNRSCCEYLIRADPLPS